jgi:hypothetical protein
MNTKANVFANTQKKKKKNIHKIDDKKNIKIEIIIYPFYIIFLLSRFQH